MDPSVHKQFHPYTTDAIVAESWQAATGRHIPFRASLRHKHATWARTAFARPELFLQPQSVDEIGLIVGLARRLRKHVVVVGSGHSPSDLTCCGSTAPAKAETWMVSLDDFGAVVSEDAERRVVVVQAGIRLHGLVRELARRSWAMPNLGSIVEQSLAGALATGTHGSSLRHGLLADSVVSLTIMLASGSLVECSPQQNADLFAAALVSLGGLGIVTHVGFRAVPAFRVRWEQGVVALPRFLASYDRVWHQSEFVRCWWFPYSQRAVVWHGKPVDEPVRAPPASWYGARLGRFTYEALLYLATWFPRLMPPIERFVFAMQYGRDEGAKGSAVQDSHEALTMDCLFPQRVNEWAIPLHRGPEAITRLEHWLAGRSELAGIPVPSDGIYVHAPIEVRVTDSSQRAGQPRAWLDQSVADGPTLFLNATLYRPFLRDVPHWQRYYQAFEFLMSDLGGKPHWAKNFVTPTPADFWRMYPQLESWVKLRDQLDPQGVFVGDWLRRNILDGEDAQRALRRNGAESDHHGFVVVGSDGEVVS